MGTAPTASKTSGSGKFLTRTGSRISWGAVGPLAQSVPAPSSLSELLMLGVLKLECTGRRDAIDWWLEHHLQRGAWEAARDEPPDTGLDTAFYCAIAKYM